MNWKRTGKTGKDAHRGPTKLAPQPRDGLPLKERHTLRPHTGPSVRGTVRPRTSCKAHSGLEVLPYLAGHLRLGVRDFSRWAIPKMASVFSLTSPSPTGKAMGSVAGAPTLDKERRRETRQSRVNAGAERAHESIADRLLCLVQPHIDFDDPTRRYAAALVRCLRRDQP